MRSLRFAPIFRKALLAAALTCLAVPAIANVITDWDAKAVAIAPAAAGVSGSWPWSTSRCSTR